MNENQNTTGGSPAETFTLRRVDWSAAFEFSLLFRAFRLAIEPPCLLLALLAIFSIYIAGRAFDVLWGPQVLRGEISAFHSPAPVYHALLVQDRINRRRMFRHLLQESSTGLSRAAIAQLCRDPDKAYAFLRSRYKRRFHAAIHALNAARPATGAAAAPTSLLRRAAARSLFERMRTIRNVTGRGIFDALMRYETRQFGLLVNNTLGLLRVGRPREPNRLWRRAARPRVSIALVPRSTNRLWRSRTIAGCLANMALTGPCWLVTGAAPMQRFPGQSNAGTWLRRGGYLASVLVFLLIVIVCLALTGAFTCRFAALSLAGKNPDFKNVLLFSWTHLLTFIKAPLLPFLTIIGTGLVLILLALPGAIPMLGEIMVGAEFLIFLLGGFIIMLMILGLMGGGALIYPALAVEGSDSFDAISRSFSYVYARSWRTLFYSLIALVYGVWTYLFLTAALTLLLATTHLCVGWGMSLFGLLHGWYSGENKLDALWAAPKFGRLIGPVNWWAMNGSEFIGALAMYFWLFLGVSLLGAYVIVYFFTSNTIVYLLLRRRVDGQPTDEIYLEPAPSDV